MIVSSKQERSALWTFPNFLRDSAMCFGSGRAGTVCPWPERLIPGWSWSVMAFCSCMGEKQIPPQSMSFSMLPLLTLSKLWGFASNSVRIFVIFWPAHGSTVYGMCPTCCCLVLTGITAFPLGACAAAGVQSACMHLQSWLQERQVIAQHRAFSSDWFFLERTVGYLCEGDCVESGDCSLLQMSSLWYWQQLRVTFLSWVNYASVCNMYVLCRTRTVCLPCFLSLIFFLQ